MKRNKVPTVLETNKISVVLGAYKNLEYTVEFIQEILRRFPDIEICVGTVGNSAVYQESVCNLFQNEPRVRIATGKADIRVAFSETWNSAINLVRTERFVFLHNDMYVHEDFFKNLNKMMDECGPESFYLYTTVEPLECMGFIRPGKIVAPFGYDPENLNVDKFNKFADKYIKSHPSYEDKGYGFFLAGFTESLRKVGGFDYTTFFPVFCEDDDINVRIRLAGFNVRVAHQALVYHFGSKTTREWLGAQMSGQEIEANRQFARKWGFEARYLWETGYEYLEDISVGAETISYTYNQGINPKPIDIINAEPFVDFLVVQPDVAKIDYFQSSVVSRKVFVEDAPESDIEICQVGPTDFNTLAFLVGSLRFYHRNLKPGKVQVGPYVVTVSKVYPDKSRVDCNNYLSLHLETSK